MLKVAIHMGDLNGRNFNNRLGVLDIAYDKKGPLSNYMVALSLSQIGELAPATVQSYPRWSASLWDLVARALTMALYQAEQAPSSGKPDRRCAYATRLCAVIERSTVTDRAAVLGTVEIAQLGSQRGRYTATFTEDILGTRTCEFEYGLKKLNPADLLLRAICWAYFESDVLGARPKLIVPATMHIEGKERFHVEGLSEPAKTGFKRFMAALYPMQTVEPMPDGVDYVRFLIEG